MLYASPLFTQSSTMSRPFQMLPFISSETVLEKTSSNSQAKKLLKSSQNAPIQSAIYQHKISGNQAGKEERQLYQYRKKYK